MLQDFLLMLLFKEYQNCMFYLLMILIIMQTKHYRLIVVDLSKQAQLDVDPRAIQQIEFYGMLNANSQVCTVLEK